MRQKTCQVSVDPSRGSRRVNASNKNKIIVNTLQLLNQVDAEITLFKGGIHPLC